MSMLLQGHQSPTAGGEFGSTAETRAGSTQMHTDVEPRWGSGNFCCWNSYKDRIVWGRVHIPCFAATVVSTSYEIYVNHELKI